MIRTQWIQTTKIHHQRTLPPPPPPPKKEKKKKLGFLGCILAHLIGCRDFLFLSLCVLDHFWPSLPNGTGHELRSLCFFLFVCLGGRGLGMDPRTWFVFFVWDGDRDRRRESRNEGHKYHQQQPQREIEGRKDRSQEQKPNRWWSLRE